MIAEDFLAGAPSALVLGDNIYYGHDFPACSNALTRAARAPRCCLPRAGPRALWRGRVRRPGPGSFLEEKPKQPRSNYAVTGLYFYDNQVVELAKSIKPSARGELEITDLNRLYLDKGQLNVELMGRGYAWLDTGTHDSLLEAGQFIATLQQRQGLKVSCPEEIAFRQGWIDRAQLETLGQALAKNGYGQYLLQILKEKVHA